MKPAAALAATTIAALALAGCSGNSSRIKQVSEDCAMYDTQVTYGSNSLTLDTGSASPAEGYGALTCVTGSLGTSDAIGERVVSTNSLMGTVEQSENGLTYSWAYHPDNGLLLSVTDGDG